MRRLLPPTLFAPLLVLTVAAGLVLPVAGPISWALRWIGAPVALFGAWLTIGGAGRFERVGTNIKTFDDPETQAQLARQNAALAGDDGAMLWAVSKDNSEKLAEYKIDALPVFDGMAAADGKLYLATQKGQVICFGSP